MSSGNLQAAGEAGAAGYKTKICQIYAPPPPQKMHNLVLGRIDYNYLSLNPVERLINEISFNACKKTRSIRCTILTFGLQNCSNLS